MEPTAEMARGSGRVLDNITVIIPTVGRPILRRCLEGIANGTVWPARIITIDQGNNPLVTDWVRRVEALGLETFHLVSSGRSPGSARNCGIEQVQTRFVAAIDDDCVPERDWLEKMEPRLLQNPNAIVTGRLLPAGNGIPPSIVTSISPCVYQRPSLRNLSYIASANMGFALRTARDIGPFDGAMSAAEDNDWAYRGLRAGVPIIYAPEIVVYHVHWRDKTQMAAVYRAYAWSQGAFYGKHLRRGDWSMLVRTAFSLFRGVRSVMVGTLNKDYDRRVDGCARLNLLLPGVIAGFRGLISSRMPVSHRE